MTADSPLSPVQVHALFDILTHHETYSEIENFKSPNAIREYGHPFVKPTDVTATSPLLQKLFNKFVLTLPGLKTVDSKFWTEQCSTIVEKLAAAELSESYERGTLGARKTVATAGSAVFEYSARGIVGGFPRRPLQDPDRQYDPENADDVLEAWEDFTQRLVYADMAEQLFEYTAKTPNLDEQTSLVRAAHEFIVATLASFIHHILILSPDGPYLLKLLENAHRLIPYVLIRQTLKVGNAATMINGMIRVVLAKISMTAVTNWIGWTNNTDDGMNLLQTIISTVLRYDTSDFQKHITKIEKSKDTLTKEQIEALKAHIKKPREEHEKIREQSKAEGKSIVSVIFASASLSKPPTETQHKIALDYFARLLDIRDREELIRILCRHNPDILTKTIKDGVATYDPIIRALHNAADLSGGLWDLECFINDLIKLSKPKAGGDLPTVGDYLDLLKKHENALHKFLHQVAKNGPELADQFKDWAIQSLRQFQGPNPQPTAEDTKSGDRDARGAGAASETLLALFQDLPASDQKPLKDVLDAHATYLESLRVLSEARFKSLINRTGETHAGPGMYLAKWQALLDNTAITPAQPSGAVRHGRDDDVRNAPRRGLPDEGKKAGEQKTKAAVNARENVPLAPDTELVARLLGEKYRLHLAQGIV